MTNLRIYTQARVSLGAAGDSLPTAPLLELRLAHARARDAVRVAFDAASLRRQMDSKGWPSILLESAARSRDEYLRRPDLGGKLSDDSANLLRSAASLRSIIFAVSDGLSAPAAERHAVPLLERIFAKFPCQPGNDGPIIVAARGRVAIGDGIGELFGASLLVLLIGERPGLSSPDSLGVYLTWAPRTGRTNAERNCISNIHGDGLSYDRAAHKIVFLIRAMQRGKLSGISLKDTSSIEPALLTESEFNRKTGLA